MRSCQRQQKKCLENNLKGTKREMQSGCHADISQSALCWRYFHAFGHCGGISRWVMSPLGPRAGHKGTRHRRSPQAGRFVLPFGGTVGRTGQRQPANKRWGSLRSSPLWQGSGGPVCKLFCFWGFFFFWCSWYFRFQSGFWQRQENYGFQ